MSTRELYGNCSAAARCFTQALIPESAGRETTVAAVTRPPLMATQTSSEVLAGTPQLLSQAPFSSTPAMAELGRSAVRSPLAKSRSWVAAAAAASQLGSEPAERPVSPERRDDSSAG